MKKLYLILLFIVPSSLFSNSYTFRHFTPFEGLSTLKTNKVLQDPDGFIWIATENGLNRFDGSSFKIYTQNVDDSTSLAGNIIMDLLIDRNGVMWVATDRGICKYVKEMDSFVPAPDTSIAHRYSKAIVQGTNNNFWVVGKSVITIFDKKWKKLQVFNQNPESKNYLGDVSFLCIAEDKDGIMWIGTKQKGFISYDFKTKEMNEYGNRMQTQEVSGIFPDSYGNVWIGTHNEAYLYKKNDDILYNLGADDCPLNLPRVPMSYMFEDIDGYIWICNWDKGVTKYSIENDTYEWYKPSENDTKSISSGSIEYGYQDNNGNLWFAGTSTGLTVSYANAKKMYTILDPNYQDAGIFHSPVTAITKDLSGNFWFGTDGSGITVWDSYNNVLKEYRHSPEDSNSYGGSSVLAAYTGSEGQIWCGGYNSGLNLHNQNDNFTVFLPDKNPPYTISGKDIRDITEDSEGNIWVATNGNGVTKINPLTFEMEVYTVDNGLAQNYCICLYYDEETNKLWIGSSGGFSILDINSAQVKVYTKNENNPESLQSNQINDIFRDSKGRYWIGTQLGLSLFEVKNEKFTTYTETQGLSNNSVMSIGEDLKGNLWIGTMDGLSKFNTETKSFFNFNINDGLPDNQFKMGAIFNSDNKIYFGTNKGVLYFTPSEITENKAVPRIRFTDFYVNNKHIEPGKNKILKEHIDFTKKIHLRHNENFFRIDFIALSYYQASKNTYKYILEGIDEDWIDSKTTNYASYTNIRHGRYTFKVQAFNNDGIPSEIREIKIKINPAWYNSKLFWLLLIGGIIYLLIKFYAYRENQSRKDKEILESRIKENENKLKEKIKELEDKEREVIDRTQHEEELKYQHEGISKFSDIIAKHREDINELATSLITNLVSYIGANAGVIYTTDDTDPQHAILKVTGQFCFDSDTTKKYEFEIGEGNVGTCFEQKKVIELNELPDGYIVLRSGLGDTSLRHNVLCPIIHEDKCLGVIEIASLNKIEKYKIEFISKLSENFASVLAITRANEQTKEMLRQNKIQSEELMAQEEEMRQNLEEMQATQEELTRHMKANEKVKQDLLREKALIDSFLKNAKENVYFKDKECRLIKASQSMADNFNVKNVEDIYGKTDFDFFTEEHARPAFEDEQEIMRTGVPIIDKVEKETHNDGTVKWVNTSKMPLYNDNGEVVGTFGISKDITESILLRNEAEELKAKFENLNKELKQKEDRIKELEAKLKK